LHRLLGGEDGDRLLRGLRYGALLSERDARVLRAFRDDSARADAERGQLEAERRRLTTLRAELAAADAALGRARATQARFLEDVRRDRQKNAGAVEELEGASRELARLVGGTGGTTGTALDPRELRGTLDWPVSGRLTARFGRTVDPRFGTAVPHPGLDLDAPAGTPFRAVLPGTVLWSGPLRGYGLTAIVDHGMGVASVYAHAAGLVVEKGEQVASGQTLGHVGDTGERSPYLYFELREGGKPVDPEGWLRKRR
jgi:septal ring factor EnvC (AmiA/AmiB activator)